MNKFMNALALGIWIFQLVYGVVHLVNGAKIHPAIFICAVLICILHYIEEIINT